MFSLSAIIYSLLFTKITHIALPVSFHKLTKKKHFADKEAILSTSASLTAETAIIFPIFLFVFFSLSCFFQILGMQLSFQIQLEETARKLNSVSYLLQIDDTEHSKQELKNNSNISKDSMPDTLVSTLMNHTACALVVKQLFLTDEIENLCNSMLINGSNGISFFKSNYDTDSQTMDIIITYCFKIPFLPDNLAYFPFVQRCHFKLWNGLQENIQTIPENQIVYLTKNSSVYHTNKYCSYLIKYANVIPFSELKSYEASAKISASPCQVCFKSFSPTSASLLYITKNAQVYHLSRDCYYLTSHIYQYNLSDISSTLEICSRCKKEN